MIKRCAYCCYKLGAADDYIYLDKYKIYSCKRCYLNIAPTKHKNFLKNN